MWYTQWRKDGGKDVLIEEAFTEEAWTDFIIQKNEEEKEEAKVLKKEAESLDEPPHSVQVKDPVKDTTSGGLNMSYK
eukprot:350020-Ditylum_brightwellii.AAC.1